MEHSQMHRTRKRRRKPTTIPTAKNTFSPSKSSILLLAAFSITGKCNILLNIFDTEHFCVTFTCSKNATQYLHRKKTVKCLWQGSITIREKTCRNSIYGHFSNIFIIFYFSSIYRNSICFLFIMPASIPSTPVNSTNATKNGFSKIPNSRSLRFCAVFNDSILHALFKIRIE